MDIHIKSFLFVYPPPQSSTCSWAHFLIAASWMQHTTKSKAYKIIWECWIKITEIDSILCFIEPFDEWLNRKSWQKWTSELNGRAHPRRIFISFIFMSAFSVVRVLLLLLFSFILYLSLLLSLCEHTFAFIFFISSVVCSCVSISCNMLSWRMKIWVWVRTTCKIACVPVCVQSVLLYLCWKLIT